MRLRSTGLLAAPDQLATGRVPSRMLGGLAGLNAAFLRTLLLWADSEGVEAAAAIFGVRPAMICRLRATLADWDKHRAYGREPFAFVTIWSRLSDSWRLAHGTGDAGIRCGEHQRMLQVVQAMLVNLICAHVHEDRLALRLVLGARSEMWKQVEEIAGQPSEWIATPHCWVTGAEALEWRVGTEPWGLGERFRAVSGLLAMETRR